MAKLQIEAHLATLGLESAAVTPYLHNLLSFTVEDEVFPKLTADLIRQRTVEALKTLVVAEAHSCPLVLLLEDAHWIDKATEEVVGTVVEAMVYVPLLLVLVYRPEYLHAWVSRAYHAQITLSGLVRTGGGGDGAGSPVKVNRGIRRQYLARATNAAVRESRVEA